MNAPAPAPPTGDEVAHTLRLEALWSLRRGDDAAETLTHVRTVNERHGAPLSDADVDAIVREAVAEVDAEKEAGVSASAPQERVGPLQALGKAGVLLQNGASYAEAREAMVRTGRYQECDIEAALELRLRRNKQGFPLTEAGDAEYFAAVHGDHVRFDHRRQRFLLLDPLSGVWLPDAVEALRGMAIDLMRLRQRVAASVLIQGDVKERMFKWAIAGESTKRLSNLLRETRAMSPIADAGDDWDSNPYLLGCPNGVVDLRTGVLRQGRPEERVTMRASVAYDPAAACPLWLDTLRTIFGGDHELLDFVHLALGYSLTGDCREECLFLMHGTGGNGKGTLINTVARVLGEYADDVPFATLERKDRADIPADVAKLVGKRLVTASESGGECELNVERIKALTGRDPITARFMRENWFTFEPVAKFWLSSNEKPTVRDDSDGFWRRVHLIPFAQSFVGRADTTLKDRLKEEHAGILAWLVEGAVSWQREGLTPPQVVRVATEEYRKENDTFAAFLDDRCIRAEHATATGGDLFRAYSGWCADHDLPPWQRLSTRKFGEEMKKRFRCEKSSTVTYYGIGIRDEAAEQHDYSLPIGEEGA